MYICFCVWLILLKVLFVRFIYVFVVGYRWFTA